MIIALWVYLVIFIFGSLLLYASEFLTPKEERDPIPETIADVFTTLVLLTGMILLAFGNEDPMLKRIWLFAAPLAFLLQGYLSWAERLKNSGSDQTADSFADIVTIILLFPALIFNLMYSLL